MLAMPRLSTALSCRTSFALAAPRLRTVLACCFCVAGTTLVAFDAHAQRRGEQGSHAAELNVDFKVAARFGDVTVPARVYRVQLSNDTLVLANPETMEVAASLPATTTDLPNAVPSRADVQVRGNDVLLVVTMGDHSYTVRGQKATGPAAAASVEAEAPDSKAERAPDATGDAAASSPADKVSQATQRYLPSLTNCIDSAQKAHWITDDPRFSNCVCPVALKWQMPKLSTPLRMHQKLVKNKFGMSFTVTNDGKVKDCRVWAGARAPEMAQPTGASAAPAAGAAAPAKP